MTEKIIRIAFKWEGPFSLKQIVKQENDWAEKTGLYQIYGTHPVFGRGALLYIGKTEESFSARFNSHSEWIKYENENIEIFLGILTSEEGQEKRDEHDLIMRSEKMLIYYCAPPYNSNELKGLGAKEDWKGEYLLYNFGRIGVLPPTLSSYWYFHEHWEKDKDHYELSRKINHGIQRK